MQFRIWIVRIISSGVCYYTLSCLYYLWFTLQLHWCIHEQWDIINRKTLCIGFIFSVKFRLQNTKKTTPYWYEWYKYNRKRNVNKMNFQNLLPMHSLSLFFSLIFETFIFFIQFFRPKRNILHNNFIRKKWNKIIYEDEVYHNTGIQMGS